MICLAVSLLVVFVSDVFGFDVVVFFGVLINIVGCGATDVVVVEVSVGKVVVVEVIVEVVVVSVVDTVVVEVVGTAVVIPVVLAKP